MRLAATKPENLCDPVYIAWLLTAGADAWEEAQAKMVKLEDALDAAYPPVPSQP